MINPLNHLFIKDSNFHCKSPDWFNNATTAIVTAFGVNALGRQWAPVRVCPEGPLAALISSLIDAPLTTALSNFFVKTKGGETIAKDRETLGKCIFVGLRVLLNFALTFALVTKISGKSFSIKAARDFGIYAAQTVVFRILLVKVRDGINGLINKFSGSKGMPSGRSLVSVSGKPSRGRANDSGRRGASFTKSPYFDETTYSNSDAKATGSSSKKRSHHRQREDFKGSTHAQAMQNFGGSGASFKESLVNLDEITELNSDNQEVDYGMFEAEVNRLPRKKGGHNRQEASTDTMNSQATQMVNELTKTEKSGDSQDEDSQEHKSESSAKSSSHHEDGGSDIDNG